MRVLMICPELPSASSPGSMAPAARQFESLRGLGIDVRTLDMRGIPILKYAQAIPKVRKLAREADLIHAHFGYCGWLAKTAFPAGRNIPLVMSFMGDDLLGTPYNQHGDLERFSRLMVVANKRLACKADQVIVKSQEMAEVIAPTPCTIIPNGVDVDAFHPTDRDEARAILGMDASAKAILFPGDPSNPRKGHALAEAAVHEAESLLGEPITLVPLWGVAPEQVYLYMNACDAMVMTSLIEGSPNVVKEALACNTPVVGVPVGDVEQLLDGVEGCEFCQRDPKRIAQALVKTLHSSQCDGRKHILQRGLDLESVARKVIDVYEVALGGNFAQCAETSPANDILTSVTDLRECPLTSDTDGQPSATELVSSGREGV